MERERWKPVVGFESKYEVSDAGAVRSTKVVRLRPGFRCGYPYVGLWDGKTYHKVPVHTLVLMAFIGKRPKGKQAAHFDGTRTNNRLVNLRWATAEENSADKNRHGTSMLGERNHRAILTRREVSEIRKLRRSGLKLTEIGSLFGLTKYHVSQICTHKIWPAAALAAKERTDGR